MTIKINGYVTEIKSVKVDITLSELEKAAEHMSYNQLLFILKNKLIKQLISNDSSLVGVELSSNETYWEVFDYYDYHRKEDKYQKLRDLSDEEIYALSSFNELFKLFSKLQ